VILMFDEIPGPRPRTSRKQAWCWAALCVLWLAIDARTPVKHSDLKWLIVATWVFCLFVHSWRLVASYRDDAEEKTTENLNG